MPATRRRRTNKGRAAKDHGVGVRTPTDKDVLQGRGGLANNHPGNRLYREFVAQRKEEYVQSKRARKTDLSKELVHLWRDQQGRFLEKDHRTGLWHDVGDAKARRKTSQLLREDAPTIRQQLHHQGGSPSVSTGDCDGESSSLESTTTATTGTEQNALVPSAAGQEEMPPLEQAYSAPSTEAVATANSGGCWNMDPNIRPVDVDDGFWSSSPPHLTDQQQHNHESSIVGVDSKPPARSINHEEAFHNHNNPHNHHDVPSDMDFGRINMMMDGLENDPVVGLAASLAVPSSQEHPTTSNAATEEEQLLGADEHLYI